MSLSNPISFHWSRLILVALFLLAGCSGGGSEGDQAANRLNPPDDINEEIDPEAPVEAAIQVSPNIYFAPGEGNTYMVVTDDGVVIIDTSSEEVAAEHYALLREVSSAPVAYILLTHAHRDHIGGVSIWRDSSTEVIAPNSHVDVMHYSARLAGFLSNRTALQKGSVAPQLGDQERNPGNFAADIQADILFDDEYSFSLGGLTFNLKHTPGESPDHMSIWIPELGAAFVGDNYYRSFPNFYTPAGTETRPALEWIDSLDLVKAWEPGLLLSGHGDPVIGKSEIQRTLTDYQRSILFVHNAVVKGMNDGKDVFSLMREIELPEELDLPQVYGRVNWAVRSIYEGYTGWYNGDVYSLNSLPIYAANSDLVLLSGGSEPVVGRAQLRLSEGKPALALHLADAALRSEPDMIAAWRVKLDALNRLLQLSQNVFETGWLKSSITQARNHITQLEPNE